MVDVDSAGVLVVEAMVESGSDDCTSVADALSVGTRLFKIDSAAERMELMVAVGI